MALISVCDKCQSPEGVQTYAIEGGGRKARVDLCETHAGLATELMDLSSTVAAASPPPRKRAAGKKRTSSAKVVTMDQIAAMK